MRFKQFLLSEQDPMGGAPPMGGPPGAPLGADPMAGGPPGMDPMGGAPPMGGPPGMGGAPPMGGPPGMDPMGGGMGGPGMGGGMAPQVPVQMKDRDVWQVLTDLLTGKAAGGKQQPPGLQSGTPPSPGTKPGGLLMQ